MTYKEIMLVIDSNRSKVRQELQIQASLIYSHSRLTSYAFNDPGNMPSLQEIFPSLFEDKEVEVQPQQQDWRIMKDILLGYADKHNEKKRKEE